MPSSRETCAVYVWDVASQELEWTTESEPGADHHPDSLAFSPDGGSLAFNFGSQLHVRELGADDGMLTLTGHSHAIHTIVFSPDGRQIVSGGDDAIRFWDLASGEEVPKFRSFVGQADRLAFAARGQTLISGLSDAVKFWDTLTRQEVFTLSVPPPSFAPSYSSSDRCKFAVSPDGSCIAFPSNDGVELLESAPLTADARTSLEAHGLVEFLYAAEKMSKERVIHRLHTFAAISDAVRRESLKAEKDIHNLLARWENWRNVDATRFVVPSIKCGSTEH